MITLCQKIVIFILLIINSNLCFSSIELNQKKIQIFNQNIEYAMKKLRVPGCAVVIVNKDKILYTASFGKRNNNKGTKVNNNTLFPLSSLTKTVTAVIVGALVDKGVLNFDDNVRKYWKEFYIGNEDISSKFTIRDLISHRSGFHHFLGDSLWWLGYSKEEIFNSLRYINNVSGFRKKYGYQNIIYGMVENVMTNATGISYDTLLEKYIIQPMQLKEISTKPLSATVSFINNFNYNLKNHGLWFAIKNFLKGVNKNVSSSHSIYEDKLIQFPYSDYFQKIKATAGVNMSITSFGEFLRMCLGRGKYNNVTIISEHTFDELTSNQVNIKKIKDDDHRFPKNRLSNIHYGMGFFNATYSNNGEKSRPILFHMGGVYGVCNFFVISPNDNIAIGILCNLGSTAITLFSELMCWRLLDILFEFPDYDWIQVELNYNEKIKQREKEWYQDISGKNPTPHVKLDMYTGTYNSEIYGNINITIEDKFLILDNGKRKTKIHHINGNTFVYDPTEISKNFFNKKEYVVFYKNQSDNFETMYISQMHENDNIFKKLKK